ncbi:MAG: hypothetical protein RJA63_2659 [Pseudomonadota bacterium]|jgi:transcriptional regulator with XRE-family HTH domain
MLPSRTSPDFPQALKAAREAKGWSHKDLADRVGISQVMPSRYENREHGSFGPPSEKTWKALNSVLFDTGDGKGHERLTLKAASVQDIVAELKARGATSVNIQF